MNGAGKMRSVLKAMMIAAPVCLTLGIASGVAEGSHSVEYRQIQQLPPERWISFAEGLPVDRRLALHEEIYDASPHSRRSFLESSFSREPEEAYQAVALRLAAGGNPSKFYAILHEIEDRSPEIMCKDGRRAFVLERLTGGDMRAPCASLFRAPCAESGE